MFSIEEPDNKILDVEKSFAPPSTVTLVWRLLASSASLVILIYDYATSRIDKFLYWGYLTMWTYFVSLVYLIVATVVSWKREPFLNQPTEREGTPHGLVKAMWALYAVAAPAQVIVIAMYWLTVVPDEGVNGWLSVWFHGGIGLLVFLDGIVVCRIPLRRRQVTLVIIYALLFLLWTLIHALTGLGDGIESSGDDLLYGVIAWNKEAGKTAILCVGLLFLALPLFFSFLWCLSLRSRPLHDPPVVDEEPLL